MSAGAPRRDSSPRGRLGPKSGLRTYLALMFKVPPKPDRDHRNPKVRGRANKRPAHRANAILLDQLVGAGEQSRWHGQPESLRRLEIEHQFEFSWLLHG